LDEDLAIKLVTAKDAERKTKLGKREYSESNRNFVTCQDRFALKFYSQLIDDDTELQYAYNKHNETHVIPIIIDLLANHALGNTDGCRTFIVRGIFLGYSKISYRTKTRYTAVLFD
jgi:hypothetical protein